jgi:hypothetical protein
MANPRVRTLALAAVDRNHDLLIRHRWAAPYTAARRPARQLPLGLAGKGSVAACAADPLAAEFSPHAERMVLYDHS